MPELPEVETVRRSLAALLAGRTIKRAEVLLPRIVRTPDAAEFCRLLAGRSIHGVGRRGKYLLLDLGAEILVSHLRMEGRYGLWGAGEPLEKHTHVIFYLDDETELRYRDVRQFGTMDLVPAADALRLSGLRELGVEPLDSAFTTEYLLGRLKEKRAPIKAALLDQSVVAGLGNIYVDEILFKAGVHPERPAHRLRRGALAAIVSVTRATIAEAIRLGGSSVKSYVDGHGTPGSYQFSLQVYGRAGQPCLRCGDIIRKGRVGGRGTHVCVRCQKPPRKALIASAQRGAAVRTADGGRRAAASSTRGERA